MFLLMVSSVSVTHRISATNSCGYHIKVKVCYRGYHIKVKVCYYGTQDCIVMDVPLWAQQESVLGIYPAL